MLRLAAAFVVMVCGAASAADLDLPTKLPQSPPEQAAPVAPEAPAAAPVPQQAIPLPPKKEGGPAAEPPAADTLHPPAGEAETRPDGWWQKLVRDAPSCKSFSDGCRTCTPGFVCSGMPIACQPKEFTCVDPKP